MSAAPLTLLSIAGVTHWRFIVVVSETGDKNGARPSIEVVTHPICFRLGVYQAMA